MWWKYPVYGLIAAAVFICGCGEGDAREMTGRATDSSDPEQAAMIGSLLTERQMEALIAGEGCFGIGSVSSCCSLVRQYYGYLWVLRIASPVEAIAAFIDGEPGQRCF
jgi:hypothetical protein